MLSEWFRKRRDRRKAEESARYAQNENNAKWVLYWMHIKCKHAEKYRPNFCVRCGEFVSDDSLTAWRRKEWVDWKPTKGGAIPIRHYGEWSRVTNEYEGGCMTLFDEVEGME